MFKFLILILLSSYLVLIKCEYPQVELPSLGKIEGRYNTTPDGAQFALFLGVPYAKPPIGNLRFEEPEKPEKWNNTIIANRTVRCIQYSHFNPAHHQGPNLNYIVYGEEDCLYLNIYTPKLKPDHLFDVFVFIHGGAFMFGAPNHNGHLFIDKEIVFVDMAYRLGPFGFLSTEDDIVPGNNGLKDQNMALQFIKKYIQYFGGNPDSVTLSGLSAGGASVIYHVISPKSKDLFHQAYAFSGSALNPWAQTENSLDKAKQLASSVDCTTNSTLDMIKCLKLIPANNITNNIASFFTFLYNPFSPFGPVVEKWGSNPFISKKPIELLKKGPIADVPVIMSMTTEEGLYPTAEFLSNHSFLSEIERNWDSYAPALLDYQYTISTNSHKSINDLIRKFYLHDQLISENSFNCLTQMVGDRLFKYTIEQTVLELSKSKKKPTYLINFGYRGNFSLTQIFGQTMKNFGVAHADDLSYILPKQPMKTKNDTIMQILMMNFLTNFIKNQKVIFHNEYLISVSGLKDRIEYLNIKGPENIQMYVSQSVCHREFWEQIPFDENVWKDEEEEKSNSNVKSINHLIIVILLFKFIITIY